MMAGCLTDLEVVALRAGTLSADHRARLEVHLSECPTCQARVRSESHGSETLIFHNLPSQAAGAGGFISIEGYDVRSEIHRGGQGVVYKAFQRSTNRTVAIKVLNREDTATANQKQRFEREVSLASSLHHSNIVTVYDSGLSSGRYYYVMEYIHGLPLDMHLRANVLDTARKLKLFMTICSAVSYAHQHGVTHRDLKPANILVDAASEPHVLDFGLAKIALGAITGQRPMSVTSEFMGTLAYAAPEQTKGDPSMIGARTDVYALGVILYEMLTGRMPYPITGDLVKTFQIICETPPQKPSDLAPIGADLETIILRALAKDPQRRYATVEELRRDIERFLHGQAIEARRDSLTYVLRARGRLLMQQQRALVNMALVLVLALVAPLMFHVFFAGWQEPILLFQKHVVGLVSPAFTSRPLQQVVIVAIEDESVLQIESIAKGEGFTDVSADQWRSVRRLHGKLMEKLVKSGVKAVVWDIEFPHPPEPDPSSQDEWSAYQQLQSYNEDLMKGVHALQAVGVNPVMAVSVWPFDSMSAMDVLPALKSAGVRWGGVGMAVGEDEPYVPWRMHLVVQRGNALPLMNISLLGYAAMVQPASAVTAHLDVDSQSVQLLFSPSTQGALKPSPGGAVQTIPLSSVARYGDIISIDVESTEMLPDDIVGFYVLDLPSEQDFAGATLRYSDVFTQSEEQLRLRLKDKLVVIGDLRNKPEHDVEGDDWYPTHDGRLLAGPQGHAAAIDMLLRNASIRFPGWWGDFTMTAGGALLGILCAGGAGAGWRRRTQFLSLTLMAIVAFGLIVYWQFGYLCNPLFPGLTVLMAFGAAIWLNKPNAARLDCHVAAAPTSWGGQFAP